MTLSNKMLPQKCQGLLAGLTQLSSGGLFGDSISCSLCDTLYDTIPSRILGSHRDPNYPRAVALVSLKEFVKMQIAEPIP